MNIQPVESTEFNVGSSFAYIMDWVTSTTISVINSAGQVVTTVNNGDPLNNQILAVNALRIASNAPNVLDQSGNILGTEVGYSLSFGVCDDVGNTGFVGVFDVNTLDRYSDAGIFVGSYNLTTPYDIGSNTDWAFRINNTYYCSYAIAGQQNLIGYDLTSGARILTLDIDNDWSPSFMACGNTTHLYAGTTDIAGILPGLIHEYTIAGVATGRTAVLPALGTDIAYVIWMTCDESTLMAVTSSQVIQTIFNAVAINLTTFTVTDITSNFSVTPMSFPACNINKAI